MSKIDPVKLHELIGAKTEWTDQLWKRALRLAVADTTLDEAIAMAEFVGGSRVPYYTTSAQYLGEYHDYPPTTLLGAYDMLRRHRLAAKHIAEIGRTLRVDQRDLSHYRVPVEQRDLSYYGVQLEGSQ